MTSAVLRKHKETYETIIQFYDFAEELINTVEDESTGDPEKQLNLVEPLIEQIEEATDLLTQQYRDFVQSGKEPDAALRRKVEDALAQIHTVLAKCQKSAG